MDVAFWLLAVVAVVSALGVIFMRKAVYSALMLAGVMLSFAVLYALQDAPFLAFVQVIVYTGAVLALFLFVLMLIGVDASDSLVETIKAQRFWAVLGALGFLTLLILGFGNVAVTRVAGFGAPGNPVEAAGGNIPALAEALFSRWVFAFELTAALLITATLAAMVVGHRQRFRARATQKEMSRERFTGPRPSPLPGPGTYARHNAVDMPALLPDGSTARESISRVIAGHELRDGTVATSPEALAAARSLEDGVEPGEPAEPSEERTTEEWTTEEWTTEERTREDEE